MLVDLDLRRGDLHEDLNVDRKLGFAIGKETKVVKINDYLDFVPRGSGIKSEFNFLSSSQLKEFMEQSKEIYDFVVLDTPPILSVSDYALVSHFVDYKIMVTRQGLTRLTEVKFSIDETEKIDNSIDALVLNDFKSSIAYYGYDYYSYKYRGSYDYEDE